MKGIAFYHAVALSKKEPASGKFANVTFEEPCACHSVVCFVGFLLLSKLPLTGRSGWPLSKTREEFVVTKFSDSLFSDSLDYSGNGVFYGNTILSCLVCPAFIL